MSRLSRNMKSIRINFIDSSRCKIRRWVWQRSFVRITRVFEQRMINYETRFYSLNRSSRMRKATLPKELLCNRVISPPKSLISAVNPTSPSPLTTRK